MSDADRNVELLKDAYKKWGDSLGSSVDEWMKICADQISFGSIAEGPPGAEYLTQFQSKSALKEYFAGLERDWQMIEYSAEHFVAQNDRVVMLGRCGWRYKKTGKVVWTRKADSWRFADGKAVEFYEYFDTAQVLAALS